MKRTNWIRMSLLLAVGVPLVSTLALVIVAAVFMRTSAQFGGEHKTDDVARYEASGHYRSGKFHNLVETSMDMSPAAMVDTLIRFVRPPPGREPSRKIPVLHPSPSEVAVPVERARLLWFGHSAFLLQVDKKNILLDPMFGPVCAPHPWLGKERFTDGLPLEIRDLPEIDAIVISHDHYDHLDYGSIVELAGKTKRFYVPLGVGAHLEAWGIEASRIEELNWWDETTLDEIRLAFVPTRHFSGRGLGDRFATLWGSWVIRGKHDNVYFSGDSGYGPHFAEIGAKYGPFDLALIECGQYDANWAQIHMMPEESAQAAVDLRAQTMMPIHWGTFVLSLHAWTDPVERVMAAAEKLAMPIRTPRIGELIDLSQPNTAREAWWRTIDSK